MQHWWKASRPEELLVSLLQDLLPMGYLSLLPLLLYAFSIQSTPEVKKTFQIMGGKQGGVVSFGINLYLDDLSAAIKGCKI